MVNTFLTLFAHNTEVIKTADCMILELKVDHTPDEAIAQIKDKKYALRFAPKIAGNREYTGRILAVGIFVV